MNSCGLVIILSLSLALASCTRDRAPNAQKSPPSSQKTSRSSNEAPPPGSLTRPKNTSPSAAVDPENASYLREAKLDEHPVAKEWNAIWREADPLTALKAFQGRHGLFLETAQPAGAISVLFNEGPCGETYITLAKNDANLDELVWEIDAQGRKLKDWHPGREKFLRVENDKLYREVDFYETVSDFNDSKPQRNERTHRFVLAIDASGTIEIMEPTPQTLKTWSVTRIDCPSNLQIESDYEYCVRETQSQRMFVLQAPCT